MIDIIRKFFIFKTHDYYFADMEDIKACRQISRYNNSFTDQTISGFKRTDGLTAHTDLTCPMEEIIDQATSQKKNVKRVMRNGGIICSETKDVDSYVSFFNAFAKARKINGYSGYGNTSYR